MPKTIEELQKELEDAQKAKAEAEASKQRLEEESKKFKTRAQEAETKLSEAEKKKLEEQGNLQELLAAEREEKKKLAERLNETTSTVLREKLRSEVAKVAKDAHDIDMILKVTDHKALLKIDEEGIKVEGVNDFVAKVRETHGFLFSKKQMPDTENKKPSDKDFDSKTSEEKYLEELKKVKNKKELYALKLKYGKPVDAYQKY
jgi:DNA repair exonuclease SbcCD ATPase subunit